MRFQPLSGRHFVAAFALLAAAHTVQAQEDAMAVAQRIATDRMAAIASKDGNRVVDMFTEDGLQVQSQGVYKGRKELLESYTASAKRGLVRQIVEPEEARRFGDVVYSYGKTTQFLEVSGEIKQSIVRYTNVIVKVNGQWKLAMLTGLPYTPAQ